MGAGVSTEGMRVAGVPVGVDAWVKTVVEKKARTVITDVAKLDIVSASSSQSAAQFLPKCAHGLGVTHPLLFSLSLWHRWMTLLLRRCAGMELQVGMWIGLHIFANLLT